MLQSEETTETESLSEFTILASNEESQHLLGQRLEQGIQDELAKEALEVEVIEREVRMQTQQAAQEAEERERRNAQSSLTAMKITVFCRKLCRRRRVCDDRGKILVAKCNYQPGRKTRNSRTASKPLCTNHPSSTGTGWNDQQL